MTITRNTRAIIVLLMVAIALAVGLTAARAILNHNGVGSGGLVGTSTAAPNVHYDFLAVPSVHYDF